MTRRGEGGSVEEDGERPGGSREDGGDGRRRAVRVGIVREREEREGGQGAQRPGILY